MVALLEFAVLALVFWSFGDRVARTLNLREPGPVERFARSAALSCGILTLLVFALAVFRKVSFASCAGVVVVMGALSHRELGENVRTLLRSAARMEWKALLWSRGGWPGWAAWITGLILVLGAIQALAPATGMDTGRMHFAAAKRMVQAHGLLSRPEPWFHRTGGFYMVYLFGMALQGELLAKLLAFAASPVAVMLAHAASERLRTGTGRTAAFVVASCPIFVGYTGYEYLELPILMYLLAAFLALHRFQEEGGAGGAALVGGMAGLALGVKITAFPMLVFLVPAAATALRRGGAARWTALGAGAATFLVAGGFWPAWNWATLGTFTFSYQAASSENALSGVVTEPWLGGVGFVLRSLVTCSEYWADSAGPLVIVAAAGVLLFRNPPEARFPALLLSGMVGFYLFVLVARMRNYLPVDAHARYLGPFLVGLGALAAGPFVAWAERGPKYLRLALLAGLLLPAGPLVGLKLGKAAIAAPAAFGFEKRSDYLAKKIETYRACEALNALPDPNVKVLFLAQRPYYLDRETVPEFLWSKVRNTSDLDRLVREEGVTHVLYEPESTLGWISDPPAVFGRAPYREIGRWPWKQRGFVLLYAVEKP